ncbi:hypothetical protein DAI22_08g102400 [Oryza sativa Japonica Group]|nr:hypothetical protein DAI22_08g102400 [Oryza sativa Japonica Group]
MHARSSHCLKAYSIVHYFFTYFLIYSNKLTNNRLSSLFFSDMYPHALLTWDVVQNRMPPLHKTVDHIYHL